MTHESAAVGIKRYGLEGLTELLASWGEPKYRAKQLVRWVYGASAASSYDDMSDLPKGLRDRLVAEQPLGRPKVLQVQTSRDGTRKYLLQLADGRLIETVGLPDADRLTVCFSTQVGCAMACSFCETGKRGLTRSLWPGEMADQLLTVAEDFGKRVTNAVAMGEGEPFANYANTLAALRIINCADALNVGARHITVSTCGLIAPLRTFAHEREQFTLAVSLHSAVQTTRDRLMPACAGQSLVELRKALVDYVEVSGRRPSLELSLIADVNDTNAEVEALIGFCRGLLCHVNLIALNVADRADSSAAVASSRQRIQEVASRLTAARIECSLRKSRGADILAACGQLKGSRVATPAKPRAPL